MIAAGLLGVVSSLAHLGSYALAGYSLAIWYGQQSSIILWDKLVILLLGASYLVLARTRSGPQWGRLIGGAMAVAVGIAMLLDDFGVENLFASSRYLSLVILVLIVAIPYRPQQAFALVLVTAGAYLACIWSLAEASVTEIDPGLLVYLIIILILCTGISALLYHIRYEQYRARRRAEELGKKVAAQAEELQQMEQIKSRFFANISHEFRTPLSLILGPVEDTLNNLNGPVSSRLRKQLRLMHRSSLRLQQLTNQLLDLSKLKAGRMRLRVRPHNLNKFLSYLIASFASLAQRKCINLSFDPGDQDHLLYFDADKLEQVVTNLLSNALKFTPKHGKVHVGLQDIDEPEGTCVEIRVHDTGPGIPKEALPYVFDRFGQVDEALAPAYIGTGIGLALARELVTLHGGSIGAESEPGFGSMFFVRLRHGKAHFNPQDLAVTDAGSDAVPLTDRTPAAVEKAETGPLDAAEAVPLEDAPTILVVDDEADLREYLRSLLSPPYRIEEAADGAEALDKIGRVQPDLIISDVLMPNLDGVALCRAVKTDETRKHIPVLLLTAKVEHEAEVEGLAKGADDYMRKPFHAGTLLARVENLIELRRYLRQRFSEEVVLQPSAISVSSADAAFLERVRAVVETHMGNSNFGVEWLADEVGVSPRHLQRKLKALTRLSAKGFVNMMRLKRAAQLLEQEAGTISEIAYTVGYQNANYFSKLFKQTFGVTPSGFNAYTTPHPS